MTEAKDPFIMVHVDVWEAIMKLTNAKGENIGRNALAVYIAIRRHMCSSTKVAFPHRSTIAAECGYKDQKSVDRYTGALVGLGAISKRDRYKTSIKGDKRRAYEKCEVFSVRTSSEYTFHDDPSQWRKRPAATDSPNTHRTRVGAGNGQGWGLETDKGRDQERTRVGAGNGQELDPGELDTEELDTEELENPHRTPPLAGGDTESEPTDETSIEEISKMRYAETPKADKYRMLEAGYMPKKDRSGWEYKGPESAKLFQRSRQDEAGTRRQ